MCSRCACRLGSSLSGSFSDTFRRALYEHMVGGWLGRRNAGARRTGHVLISAAYFCCRIPSLLASNASRLCTFTLSEASAINSIREVLGPF